MIFYAELNYVRVKKVTIFFSKFKKKISKKLFDCKIHTTISVVLYAKPAKNSARKLHFCPSYKVFCFGVVTKTVLVTTPKQKTL